MARGNHYHRPECPHYHPYNEAEERAEITGPDYFGMARRARRERAQRERVLQQRLQDEALGLERRPQYEDDYEGMAGRTSVSPYDLQSTS